jgi:serine/threonine protein kinase/Tol biopolymer transport system component
VTPERWRQLSTIYHAATQQTAADREGYLAEACGGDPELRHEVESLLAHDGHESFLSARTALPIGTCVGSYEVVAQIGEGGMGVVYRARDTKLHRDVALKLLSDAFASDPDRLARFRREAQVLASLNHPNIAHVYGLEQAEGIQALVMELVEGEDLSERIAQGPVPLDEALPIAKQIAEALEAAHDQGVIHRDLKPANIKLRRDGMVKVLDFGLAKALEPMSAASVDAATALPTITSPALMTGVGLLIGTAAYMSPEQAKGRAADKRSDIWAFGCVFYELLTGRRPFDGEDVVDVLGAVARLEPDWDALPATVPTPVRTLLQRCLAKDRRHRVGDISTALFIIDNAENLAPSTLAAATASSSRGSTYTGWLMFAAASVLLIGMTAFVLLRGDHGAPRPEPMRFEVLPPEGAVFGGVPSGGTGLATQLAVSPDGRRIAFVARTAAQYQLWLRTIDSVDARVVAGTEGAAFPFWSPDGGSVGFFSGGKLKSVSVDGGPPAQLCDAEGGRGATWSRDGVILFNEIDGRLRRVSAAGGERAVVLSPPTGNSDTRLRWPHFLPDGRHFLYTEIAGGNSNITKAGIVKIGSLDDREIATLLEAESSAVYGSGHVLFARNGMLMAQPFDPQTRRLMGDATPLAEHIGNEGSRYTSASVSENGILVFAALPDAGTQQLTWFDRSGRVLGPLGGAAIDQDIALSPDQRRVAAASGTPDGRDIWVTGIARSDRLRLTLGREEHQSPVWSPDGTYVAFETRRGGKSSLRQQRVDAAGGDDLLVEADVGTMTPTSWSPDGRYIAYTFQRGFPQVTDIRVLPLFGDRKAFSVADTRFREDSATFSPTQTWMAYVSDESGQFNVYLQSFPKGDRKYSVSTDGGTRPIWRSDGKELFFLDRDGNVMSVSIDGSTDLQITVPQRLFATGLRLDDGLFDTLRKVYAVRGDGERFLVALGQRGTTPPLTVLVNWLATVRK